MPISRSIIKFSKNKKNIFWIHNKGPSHQTSTSYDKHCDLYSGYRHFFVAIQVFVTNGSKFLNINKMIQGSIEDHIIMKILYSKIQLTLFVLQFGLQSLLKLIENIEEKTPKFFKNSHNQVKTQNFKKLNFRIYSKGPSHQKSTSCDKNCDLQRGYRQQSRFLPQNRKLLSEYKKMI